MTVLPGISEKIKRSTLTFCVSLCLVFDSGCFGHTDFIMVDPIRYVPAPAKPIPNLTFGWVNTSVEKAEGFRVSVGDLTYHRIIQPFIKNDKITSEEAISAFADFAEKEVVRQRLCDKAKVPLEARKLVGSETPPEMWMLVKCVK